MPDNGVTRQDLLDLEDRLKSTLNALEERLIERIRDAQTELLRGFERFQTAEIIRMRKIEVDQSNLSTSTSIRLDNPEERVLEIEKRLLVQPPPKS